MKRVVALLVVLAVCVLAGVVTAEEPAYEKLPVLSDLKLGDHWHGPKITLDDLRGKVVLFVIWGS
jgi:hypothetical protein